jgi:starch synthase
MKVTIVVGGRWHAFDLAERLNEQGHLYKLITNYPSWYVSKWSIPRSKIITLPFTFWLVKAIYKVGGQNLMMRCQWFVHQWFAKRACNYLEGSELIHGWAQWSEPSFQWAKKNGVPTVLERSSSHILEQNKLLTEEYRRHGLKWLPTHEKVIAMELNEYQLSTSIAIPSLFVEKSFIRRGMEVEQLMRNSLGVNLKQFNTTEEKLLSPTKEGLKIIFAGSMSIRKGIPDLIEGFKKARLFNSQLTLVGGCTKEVERFLDFKDDRIKIIGHRPQNELPVHYRRAHCFVMPSIEEGMAMVQMQALACGLPLICTTNTGGEDLLRLSEGKIELKGDGIVEFPAGFLLPVNSPDAISSCLKRLATEEGLWENKRDSAIKIAKNNLSWSSYADKNIEHYKYLLHCTK